MVSAADIYNARILIVDDLPANVRLLEQALRMAGYTQVTSTQSPSEVCALHRALPYDLILLDLQMPVMDGFEVMTALKEIETEGYLPVLVVTAQPAHKLRALRAGARDFISKPIDIIEVQARVYNLVEVRLLHQRAKAHAVALAQSLREVEESHELLRKERAEVQTLYDKLLVEQHRSERLLLNVLPRAIAERLKGRGDSLGGALPEVIADTFPEATVLFADIVGFTKLAPRVTPVQLVELLNEIFTSFDAIADHRGLEKIKTIGDAYMAAAGLPEPAMDHAERGAHMALDMLAALETFNVRTGHSLQMRIGMCSGPVIAGVIGQNKFIYDLWGETVNIASRMESHGISGRIQITQSTANQLGPSFHLEPRGTIEVKGLGEVRTCFLEGRKS